MPVSEVSFHRLDDSPIDVQRSVLIVFGWLWGPLGASKTWIPFSTSVKNQVFRVFASKTPLGRTFEAFWSGWRRLQRLSRRPLGGSLATLTGVPVSKIRFVRASGGVGAFSCFRMVSREAFGRYLHPLFVIRSGIFTIIVCSELHF